MSYRPNDGAEPSNGESEQSGNNMFMDGKDMSSSWTQFPDGSILN